MTYQPAFFDPPAVAPDPKQARRRARKLRRVVKTIQDCIAERRSGIIQHYNLAVGYGAQYAAAQEAVKIMERLDEADEFVGDLLEVFGEEGF